MFTYEAQEIPSKQKFYCDVFSKDMQDPEMLLNSSFVPVADKYSLSVSTLERASINHKIFILEAGTEIKSTRYSYCDIFCRLCFCKWRGVDVFRGLVKNGSGTDSLALTSAAVDEDGQHLVLTLNKGVTVGETRLLILQ